MPLTPTNSSPATLSARQRHFYVHSCCLWKPVVEFGPDSVETGERWELSEVGVKCFFDMALNADETHPFGRIAYDSLLTLDQILFGLDQDIDSDWIAGNTTLNTDGTPSHNYGFFWRVRGPARIFSNAGRRHAGRKLVLAYREKTPPEGVSIVP